MILISNDNRQMPDGSGALFLGNWNDNTVPVLIPAINASEADWA